MLPVGSGPRGLVLGGFSQGVPAQAVACSGGLGGLALGGPGGDSPGMATLLWAVRILLECILVLY